MRARCARARRARKAGAYAQPRPAEVTRLRALVANAGRQTSRHPSTAKLR
jgi:hypothetical protein